MPDATWVQSVKAIVVARRRRERRGRRDRRALQGAHRVVQEAAVRRVRRRAAASRLGRRLRRARRPLRRRRLPRRPHPLRLAATAPGRGEDLGRRGADEHDVLAEARSRRRARRRRPCPARARRPRASGSTPRPTPCVIGRSPTRAPGRQRRDDVVPSRRRQLAAVAVASGRGSPPTRRGRPRLGTRRAPTTRSDRVSRTRSSPPSSAVIASNAGVVTPAAAARSMNAARRAAAVAFGSLTCAHRGERVDGDGCRVAERRDLRPASSRGAACGASVSRRRRSRWAAPSRAASRAPGVMPSTPMRAALGQARAPRAAARRGAPGSTSSAGRTPTRSLRTTTAAGVKRRVPASQSFGSPVNARA